MLEALIGTTLRLGGAGAAGYLVAREQYVPAAACALGALGVEWWSQRRHQHDRVRQEEELRRWQASHDYWRAEAKSMRQSVQPRRSKEINTLRPS